MASNTLTTGIPTHKFYYPFITIDMDICEMDYLLIPSAVSDQNLIKSMEHMK